MGFEITDEEVGPTLQDLDFERFEGFLDKHVTFDVSLIVRSSTIKGAYSETPEPLIVQKRHWMHLTPEGADSLECFLGIINYDLDRGRIVNRDERFVPEFNMMRTCYVRLNHATLSGNQYSVIEDESGLLVARLKKVGIRRLPVSNRKETSRRAARRSKAFRDVVLAEAIKAPIAEDAGRYVRSVRSPCMSTSPPPYK